MFSITFWRVFNAVMYFEVSFAQDDLSVCNAVIKAVVVAAGPTEGVVVIAEVAATKVAIDGEAVVFVPAVAAAVDAVPAVESEVAADGFPIQCTTHPSSSLNLATTSSSSSLHGINRPRKISLRLDLGMLVVLDTKSCNSTADIFEFIFRGMRGLDAEEVRESEMFSSVMVPMVSEG